MDGRRCGGWDDGGRGAGDGVGEAVLGGERCEAGECRDVVFYAWIVAASEDETTWDAARGEKSSEGFDGEADVLLGLKAVEGDESRPVTE